MKRLLFLSLILFLGCEKEPVNPYFKEYLFIQNISGVEILSADISGTQSVELDVKRLDKGYKIQYLGESIVLNVNFPTKAFHLYMVNVEPNTKFYIHKNIILTTK